MSFDTNTRLMLVLQINDLEHILRSICRIEYSGQLKMYEEKKLSKPNNWRNSSLRFRLHAGLVWLFRAIKVITVLSVLVYYSRRIRVLASACIEFHTVRKNIELSGVSFPSSHGGL